MCLEGFSLAGFLKVYGLGCALKASEFGVWCFRL